ncbi:MAG: OmpP1/FadL family transporter [Bacteroidales bacterium]
MKNVMRTSALVILITIVISASKTTYATDGYFSLGYGAQNKGLAGAGIAWYKNSMINGNPAGPVFLGKKYQFGVGLFSPNREYTIAGNPSGMPGTFGLTPGNVESDSKMFFIPSIGANWMLNEKSSLSATIFGNGGMNTDYPTQTFYDASSSSTGVNLAQLFLGLTYSRKIAEKHSLGITVLATYQYFDAKGVASFAAMSSNPDKLSGNGKDNGFGIGVKVGYMGQIFDGFTLGASYQPKINMSKFDDYSGLFAEKGGFDIPSNWTLGIAYEFNSKWVAMVDYKRINYSEVASISNPLDPTAFATAPLGSNKGAGFGWEDINVYKVGIEYSGIPGWVLRGGYSHCDQPIPSSEVLFNILAPGVVQDHLTLGCSKNIGDSGRAIHLAMVYALPSSVKGYNPMDFDPDQAALGNYVPNQTIKIEMSQVEFEVAYTF